jgi:signal transduction histidine kinase
VASVLGRTPALAIWSLLAAACLVVMWLSPGRETLPYHLAWIGLSIAYCFDAGTRHAVAALAAYTVLSGAILVHRAAEGVIAWEETGEIPLMAVLVGLMVWHARRRFAALCELRAVARQEVRQATQRERLGRMATHEMRTSLTVASGYVDLLLTRPRAHGERTEIETIRDELVHLRRTSERALRMFRLPDTAAPEAIDLGGLVRATAARWDAVTERRLVVSVAPGVVHGSSDRLQTCLDTLIENALRYTAPGGQVRLVGFSKGDATYLGVADSGPGMPADLSMAINRGTAFRDGHARLVGEHPEDSGHTGLGLVLVDAVVTARGGRLLAGRSAEGGALLLMRLPAEAATGRVESSAVPDVRRAVPASLPA